MENQSKQDERENNQYNTKRKKKNKRFIRSRAAKSYGGAPRQNTGKGPSPTYYNLFL